MSTIAKQASDGDDAFFERLFSKLPKDVARSFYNTQLKAISTAFGMRRWRDHDEELRLLIPIFGRSYYFVLLVGTERRSRKRRLRDRLYYLQISAGNCIFAVVFFTAVLRSWWCFMFSSRCWELTCFSAFRLALCRSQRMNGICCSAEHG